MTNRAGRRRRHKRHKANSGSRKPRLLWSIEHVDLGEQDAGYLTAELRVVPFVATGNTVRPAREHEAEPITARTRVLKMGEPQMERQLRTVELVEACQRIEMEFLRMLRPYRGKGQRTLHDLMRDGLDAVDLKQATLLLNGQPITVRRGGLGG